MMVETLLLTVNVTRAFWPIESLDGLHRKTDAYSQHARHPRWVGIRILGLSDNLFPPSDMVIGPVIGY